LDRENPHRAVKNRQTEDDLGYVFNQFGDVELCALRPGNVHSAAE
jgi:hypothetical protein